MNIFLKNIFVVVWLSFYTFGLVNLSTLSTLKLNMKSLITFYWKWKMKIILTFTIQFNLHFHTRP